MLYNCGFILSFSCIIYSELFYLVKFITFYLFMDEMGINSIIIEYVNFLWFLFFHFRFCLVISYDLRILIYQYCNQFFSIRFNYLQSFWANMYIQLFLLSAPPSLFSLQANFFILFLLNLENTNIRQLKLQYHLFFVFVH